MPICRRVIGAVFAMLLELFWRKARPLQSFNKAGKFSFYHNDLNVVAEFLLFAFYNWQSGQLCEVSSFQRPTFLNKVYSAGPLETIKTSELLFFSFAVFVFFWSAFETFFDI